MSTQAQTGHEVRDADRVRDAYLSALLAGELDAARAVIDGALRDGASARDIYLEVLQPALYEVGRRWSRAEISVAQEHLATAATQSTLARLAGSLGAGTDTARGRVVVACAEDELHVVGLRMVADFLEAAGWEVVFVAAMTPAAGLLELAAGAEAVALSAALPERIPTVARAVTQLRALPEPPLIVVGGQAFAGSPERGLATGADAWAADAEDAVRVLDERLAA
jgi:MerR family transcriptional regulator, light-induced transcriptional regulator